MPVPLSVCMSENLQLLAGRITILEWCQRQMTSKESKRASGSACKQKCMMFQDLDASPIGSYNCFVPQSSNEIEVRLRTLRITMAGRSAAHVMYKYVA